jgi:hypothetical protein
VEGHSEASDGSGLGWDERVDEALDSGVEFGASGEGGEGDLREGLEDGFVVELATGA